IEYGWTARGGGYSYTVSEEGRLLFKERVKIAREELNEAKKLKERCPQWYESMLTIAQAQGWNLDEYDEVYREAVEFEPDYYYYALCKGTYLLPRWHGAPGQWEAFLDSAANEAGGARGLMIYYLVATDYIIDYPDAEFSTGKISVEKIKRGFYELKKLYGADKQRLNEFAKFVCMVDDYPAAKEVLEEIGDNRIEEILGSKDFEQCRLMSDAVAKKTYAEQSRRR
ncbi:MAG: hypothetical protein M3384_09350, partial [Acidobacteriota bacterium]|nr:hypothetical protein [Acidobacteriota bacterium]